MGQVQSEPVGQTQTQHSSPSPSTKSLLAEAVAYGDSGNETLEAKAQKALECPCIADLRSGPCGDQFSEAFVCFLKSTAEEKGSDCVHPFVALQNCIKVNPTAFSKDVSEEEQQAVPQEYKIIPPLWSGESSTSKSKLWGDDQNLVRCRVEVFYSLRSSGLCLECNC